MIPLVNPARARQSAAIQPWLRGAVRWIVVVLALVATADAGYLTWNSFTHGAVAGCDAGGHVDCDEVLTSRWSRAAGLPVAVGGLLCYGTILVLALASGTRTFNENAWMGTVLAAAAFLALFAGTWFTGLQIFALGKFCYYCLGIHLCGMITALLVVWSAIGNRPQATGGSLSHSAVMAVPGGRRPAGPRPAERPYLLAAAPVAAIALAALVAVQVMFPTKMFQVSSPDLTETIDMTAKDDEPAGDSDELSPSAQSYVVNRVSKDDAGDSGAADPDAADSADTAEKPAARRDDQVQLATAEEETTADTAPELSREVKFLKGRIKLDTYNEAVLGSPDAKYVVVEMMDYTCPHCRKMHAHIREARERYGDQLAVVILPVPLELECNKLVPATDPSHRGACKISRTALAVGKVDHNKFLDFHNFLLKDEKKPPTASQAVLRAFRLLGSKKFGEGGSGKELDNRIQKYIQLYSTLSAEHRGDKSFGLPVQIVGDTVLAGGEMTSEELFEAWEKALDIKPL